MTQTQAVAPIISGPSQADGIARFALRTTYEDLTVERRERFKVSILDAVACAINALGAPPIEACRAQTEELGSPGSEKPFNSESRGTQHQLGIYGTAAFLLFSTLGACLPDRRLRPGGKRCCPSQRAFGPRLGN